MHFNDKTKNKFRCPRCNNLISIREIFRFQRNHQTICRNCNAVLSPRKIKSFNWGFGIGFAAVVIPAQIILYYYDDYSVAACVSLFGGALAVLAVALHTYLTTEFEEI